VLNLGLLIQTEVFELFANILNNLGIFLSLVYGC